MLSNRHFIICSFVAALILLSAAAGLHAFLANMERTQAEVGQPSPAYLESVRQAKVSQSTYGQWFAAARFGMLITWGPNCLTGKEISWSRSGPTRTSAGTVVPQQASVPAERYDSLYREFNPTAFDARAWVAAAQSAGMTYLVFTAKHHDGFCMFDTATTDYKITNTPLHRDVTAELAAACHAAGLRFGIYYSPPDWHHPDFRTTQHARYRAYMHAQIRELCTRYGAVDILWFDGLDCSAEELDSPALFAMIRKLQPGILINDRAGLLGDFGTPEKYVDETKGLNRLWESCYPIGEQWSYKPGDKIKSCDEILKLLTLCNRLHGNLLLDVGPMPTGEMDPECARRLREVGEKLKAAQNQPDAS